MPKIISEKIRIGISACNFGALVRYNRRGWDSLAVLGRERDAFIWTPVCPEVMSGLGVPRAPMKLVDGNGDDFWERKARMKNRKGEDVGERMRSACEEALAVLRRAQAEAYVYMDGSPTCGVYRTSLKNARIGKPPGVFGSLLLREDLFLIPAADLASPLRWWDWRRRLHAFVWLKRQSISTKAELLSVWHDFKFLCQEIDRPAADALSHRLADMPKRLEPAFVEEIRKTMLSIVRQPSSEKRIRGWAQKAMAFYRKRSLDCPECQLPSSDRSKREFLERLIVLEKKAFSEGKDFGFVPVLYRGDSR